ncbi:hypothetical protein K491DRAFT_602045, partial [Lophiostoma macrostomum CBS 122681]
RRVRTPNCTHIDMDRIYTRDQQCYVCGHTPSIGFLYVCRQDQHPLSAVSIEHVSAEEHHDCVQSELHQSLVASGLSASVIETAKRGIYTDDQLQKLKRQRSELKQAIQDVVVGNQINAMAAQLASPTTQGTSNTDGTSSSLLEKEQLIPTCTFRACHTCRPYYRDRVYASIPSVISNQQRPLTPEDASVLPTKNSRILRKIGLLPNPVPAAHPPDNEPLSPSTLPTSTDGTGTGTGDTGNITPSRASILTFRTTQTDLSTVQRLSNPRKRFYSLGSKSSRSMPGSLSGAPSVTRKLKFAIRGFFNTRADSPSIQSESTNNTVLLPGPGTTRDHTAGKPGDKTGNLEIGSSRRIRRQKDSADLRNGVYAGGHQGIRVSDRKTSRKIGDDTSSDSDSEYSVYSCSSQGEEVEVSGGVALTEEAVETHTPDILDTGRGAAVVSADANANEEVCGAGAHDVGGDETGDVGLQSIMAQV